MRNNQPNNDNRNTIRKLFIIVLASIVFGFGVYFSIVLWAFPVFSVNISGVTDWNMLEGFASVLSLSLLAGGLIFAVTEYINTENTKQHEKLVEDREKAKLSYDIYKAIFDKLTDPEQEAARRWILSNISIKKDDEDIAAWYEKTHKKITSGGTKAHGRPARGTKSGQTDLELLRLHRVCRQPLLGGRKRLAGLDQCAHRQDLAADRTLCLAYPHTA